MLTSVYKKTVVGEAYIIQIQILEDKGKSKALISCPISPCCMAFIAREFIRVKPCCCDPICCQRKCAVPVIDTLTSLYINLNISWEDR